jgi:hypothetical protein
MNRATDSFHGDDRRILIALMAKRFPSTGWIGVLAGILAFAGWAAVSAVPAIFIANVVDGSPQLAQATAGIVIVMLTWGGALFAGLWTAVTVQERLVYRHIDRHLHTPLCVWCGHNVTGVPIDHARHCTTCPECGKPTPVAPRKSDDPKAQ